MDIFNVLIIYVYFLFGVFAVQAVTTAVCTAVKQVTGQTVTEHVQYVLTWAPLWAWRVQDKLFPVKGEQPRYFLF